MTEQYSIVGTFKRVQVLGASVLGMVIDIPDITRRMDNGQNNALNVRLLEQFSTTTWTLLYAPYTKFSSSKKEETVREISNLCLPYLEILLRVGESRRACAL